MFDLFPLVLSNGIPQSGPMNDQEVADPLVTGIYNAFLGRHSQDEDLLEWLQASAGASCMASIIWLFLPKHKLELMFSSIEPYAPSQMYFSGNLFPALRTVNTYLHPPLFLLANKR